MPPRVPAGQLSFARTLRSQMTAAETMLCRTLRNRGVAAKFRRQVPIDPYVADFACVTARLVVELDGEPHDTAERQHRDHGRDAWLASQGWRVLRLGNDEVIGGGDSVVDRIRRALSRVPSSDPR